MTATSDVLAATLDADAARTAGAGRVGGKAWNLARLARHGFAVPAFRVVPPGDAPTPAALAAIQGELGGGPLAVRSSALEEDGAAASFAGILESELGVSGAADLAAALTRVRASGEAPRVKDYRARVGLEGPTAVAVVLQAMVEPGWAGVAFTADPETGRRDRVRIEATPGRGDALVGGRATPHAFRVGLSADGATCDELSAPPGRGPPRSLIERVARLAVRVQWALGEGQVPQDVEWAWDGAALWLVQARPITGIREVTPAGYPALPHLWSNANMGDVLPHVVTDMTWSCLEMTLAEMFATPFQVAGFPMPEGMQLARRIRGRGYFELGFAQWLMYDCFGLTPAEVNHSFGGHQPEIEVPPSPLSGWRGWRRLGRRLRLLRAMVGLSRKQVRWTRRLEPWLRELRERDLAALDRSGVRAFLAEMRDRVRGFYPFYNLANALASAWQDALRGACERVVPGRGSALASRLLAGRGAVPSAEAGYRLADLAGLARAEEAARTWLARQVENPDQGAPPPPGDFARAWAAYLEEFGHRAGYECELAHPRWREDPRELLSAIHALATSSEEGDPREAARRVRRGAEAELRAASRWSAPAVSWLASRAHAASAAREQAKSLLIGLAEAWRHLGLAIGGHLAAAGHLAQAEDVFHLAYLDLEAWARGEWDGAGAASRAEDGRARAAAWGGEVPPPVLREGEPLAPAPPEGSASPEAPEPDQAPGWRGVAASAGRARGRARLVHIPGDATDFAAGDVLVAPSTDPGWTPLLLRASAIVTEVGGYLSHGAIVAREMGVPAVVNVPGLMGEVREGEELVVDGDRGFVRRSAPDS